MAVGSIVWKLLMDTAGFQTDSKRAASHLKELRNEAKETRERMSKLTETFLGFGLSFGAITYAMKETIDKMDETAKAARGIGMSANELSKLQYAASLGGVAAEDLNSAVAKMAKTAATNDEAFRAMGLSVKDSTGKMKPTSQLVSEIAAKFATYRDSTEKTALAQDLFGKSGAKLMSMLNSGADGLRAMGDEATALGAAIDDNAAKAAEDFNDNLTRLKSAGFGALMSGVSGAMPALLGIGDAFAGAAKQGDNFKSIGTGVGNLLRGVTSIFAGSSTAAELLGVSIGGLMAVLAQPISRKGFARAGEIIEQMKSDLSDIASGAGAKVAAIWDDTGRAAELAGKKGEEAGKATATATAPVVQKLKDAEAAAKKLKAEMKQVIDAMIKEGDALHKSLYTPSEKLLQKQADISRLRAVGAIDPGIAAKANREAMKEYDNAIQAQRDLLTEGLRSEEDEIRKSYEKRRKDILAASELTETQKQSAIAAQSEKMEKDLAAAQLQRYRDLLTPEQQLTQDYMARKQAIYDDDALSQEKRNQYLLALSDQYHKAESKLDADAQEKKLDVLRSQLDATQQGFEGTSAILKATQNEQSDTYQAMFAASKAFALADITIKQSQAIAKAWGENNYWVAAGLTVGLVGQFAGLISSAQSASFGGTRADGGPTNAGRTYLVGERGPELFTAPENGRIISAQDLQPQQSQQNIRIVNAYDTDHVGDFMGSAAGEKRIMNVVRRNQSAIRQIAGG